MSELLALWVGGAGGWSGVPGEKKDCAYSILLLLLVVVVFKKIFFSSSSFFKFIL